MQIIANAYCRFFGHRLDVIKHSKKIGRDVYYKCVRCGKDFFAYCELLDLSEAKKPAPPPPSVEMKEDTIYYYNPATVEAVRTTIHESSPKFTSGGGDFVGGGAEGVFEVTRSVQESESCRRDESPPSPSYCSRDDDSRNDSGSSSSDSGSSWSE